MPYTLFFITHLYLKNFKILLHANSHFFIHSLLVSNTQYQISIPGVVPHNIRHLFPGMDCVEVASKLSIERVPDSTPWHGTSKVTFEVTLPNTFHLMGFEIVDEKVTLRTFFLTTVPLPLVVLVSGFRIRLLLLRRVILTLSSAPTSGSNRHIVNPLVKLL